MVLFHFSALVDDLITQEEFEARVEVIGECSDLLVADRGDAHGDSVREVAGKSSLFCFAKVIGLKSSRKPQPGTTGEKGWVATLLRGRRTGTTQVLCRTGGGCGLWSWRGYGDYRENTTGKKSPGGAALALRKATSEITCNVTSRWERVGTVHRAGDLDALLIGQIRGPASWRRDGTTGE